MNRLLQRLLCVVRGHRWRVSREVRGAALLRVDRECVRCGHRRPRRGRRVR